MKPIPYYRFVKAVTRAKELYTIKEQPISASIFPSIGDSVNYDNFIFVKSEYENIKINTNDIKYIQGLKDYLKIHVTNTSKPILTLMNFKDLQNKISTDQFLRVHKSYLINVIHIKAVQKSKILIDDIRIPIGDSYKTEIYAKLGL